MKSKKGFITVLFLLIVAGAVFFIGWIQLYVPVGKYGVLTTKTNGTDPAVIKEGALMWKWQKLLPTNATIRVFSSTTYINRSTIEGTLPSADIYSALLEGRPDFSYRFIIETTAAVNPEKLPEMVEKLHIEDDESLSAYVDKESELTARYASEYLLRKASEKPEEMISTVLDEQEMLDYVMGKWNSQYVDILGMRVVTSKIPDVTLYVTAKEVYLSYQDGIKEALLAVAEDQSGLAGSDFLQIERFGKLGKVLTDYPILIDFLAVTRQNASDAFDVLESIRK